MICWCDDTVGVMIPLMWWYRWCDDLLVWWYRWCNDLLVWWYGWCDDIVGEMICWCDDTVGVMIPLMWWYRWCDDIVGVMICLCDDTVGVMICWCDYLLVQQVNSRLYKVKGLSDYGYIKEKLLKTKTCRGKNGLILQPLYWLSGNVNFHLQVCVNQQRTSKFCCVFHYWLF